MPTTRGENCWAGQNPAADRVWAHERHARTWTASLRHAQDKRGRERPIFCSALHFLTTIARHPSAQDEPPVPRRLQGLTLDADFDDWTRLHTPRFCWSRIRSMSLFKRRAQTLIALFTVSRSESSSSFRRPFWSDQVACCCCLAYHCCVSLY